MHKVRVKVHFFSPYGYAIDLAPLIIKKKIILYLLHCHDTFVESGHHIYVLLFLSCMVSAELVAVDDYIWSEVY